jgi:hypothetical protein
VSRSKLLLAAVTTFGFASSFAVAHAEYCPPSPARDFSASYYQSPGGVGRARYPAWVYGYVRRASDATLPSPRSCGGRRVWKAGRCVDPRADK